MLSVLNKHRYKIIMAVVIIVVLCVAWTVGGGYAKDGAGTDNNATILTNAGDGRGNDTNADDANAGGNAGGSDSTDSNINGNGSSANNGAGANNAAGAVGASNGRQNDAAQSGGNTVESTTPVPSPIPDKNGTEASQGTAGDNSEGQADKEGDGAASEGQSSANQTQSGSNQSSVVSATPTPVDASSQTTQSPADASASLQSPQPSAGASQQSPQSEFPADADNSTAQGSDTESGKGAYNTNPIPDGKPAPVEPQDAKISDTALTCTISVRCDTIINNMKYLNREKHELVPEDGWILKPTTVTFYEGESVFNVLQREMRRARIHLEFSNVPIYNSAYIEGINNLYEFDVGELSGWMFKVNDWFPNFGSSRYQLMDGDVIAWVYTCDLGEDVGGGYAVGNR